ncbi:MAG: TonB-dependent receptor, partial [Candidatus Binatia bacterium]
LGGLIFDSEFSSETSVISGDDFVPWALSAAGFEALTGQEPPGGVGFQTIQQAAGALGVTLPNGILAGDGFHIRAAQEMQSKAIFGQLAWRPTEQWTLSFGARANFEDKEAAIVLDCFTPGLACAAAGGSDYTANPERSESDVSPKVSLQYFPWENLSLFTTYAQGYKSGGFNNLSLTPSGIEVEPEKTESWEVGAKGTLFGETLSYGVTLFNMDVEDLQLQNFISSTIVLVRNAASARSRGIELDAQWLTPWQPLSLRASGALTDAAFKEYPNAPAPRGSGANQDLSGERLPYSPQQQFSLTPELRFPFDTPELPLLGTRGLVVATALDVNYIGDLFLDGDLDPNVHQDAYSLMNGRLALKNATETLSLGLVVENLTDNDVLTFTTDSTLFPGGYMGSQQTQRNWYLEARVAW